MSTFQDFESYLGTEIDLVEENIRLISGEYNSNFMIYELEPCIYTFKDLSEALFKFLQPESEVFNNSIDIEFDDITIKTELIVRPSIIATRFDEKSVFSTVLDFTADWDYKHYNEYNSQKIMNLSTINKIHLKCDVIYGSVVSGLRQPTLYS